MSLFQLRTLHSYQSRLPFRHICRTIMSDSQNSLDLSYTPDPTSSPYPRTASYPSLLEPIRDGRPDIQPIPIHGHLVFSATHRLALEIG